MRKLKVAVIVLGVVFLTFVVFQVMDLFMTGKQFIYNLSQMEYEDAYQIVRNMADEALSTEYTITEEMIRSELDHYLVDAKELSGWERTIYELHPSLKTGVLHQVGVANTVVLIALIIWKELRDAERRDAESLDIRV